MSAKTSRQAALAKTGPLSVFREGRKTGFLFFAAAGAGAGIVRHYTQFRL
jgi:hypothetical protein